jgi:hypothetical protein
VPGPAGFGFGVDALTFPVMVIPTRRVLRLSAAKAADACSTQSMKTDLHMVSLLASALSDFAAVVYRDGTVPPSLRRATATPADAQQERDQGRASKNVNPKA